MPTLPPLAKHLVTQQRDPPRNVPSRSLLLHVVHQRSNQALFVVGLVFGVAGLASGYFRIGVTSRTDTVVLYAVAGGGLLVAATPLVLWRRLLTALRSAPLGEAVVRDVALDVDSRATLDALANGFATGTWSVVTGKRAFSERFEIDAPWARTVRVHSRICVLVHPKRPKTLFAVQLLGAV